MKRKIRVLVGKPGLDGHDRGAKVVAASLRDAGMEVIYTGLHQTPEQIVEAATQEDVDVVALSILSGAHMTLFPQVMTLMRARGIGDRLLTGGGIIPAADMDSLAKKGVGRLFGPGASTHDIAQYIREWFDEGQRGTASGARGKPGPRKVASAAATPRSRRPLSASRGPAAKPKPSPRRPSAAPAKRARRSSAATPKPARGSRTPASRRPSAARKSPSKRKRR